MTLFTRIPGALAARAGALCLAIAGSAAAQNEAFVRGDLNRDGQVSLADVSHYFDYRFLGAPGPGCEDAADVNDGGTLDTAGIVDAQLLIDWLFRTAFPAPLPSPFPGPGSDPTGDRLTCSAPAADEPPGRDRDFAMTWDAPPAAAPGQEDVQFFLLATTPEKIASISIAYRVKKSVLENVRADLRGTIVPAGIAADIQSSPVFRVAVLPSADPDSQLLTVGVVFVVETPTGYERPQFAATTGSLDGAPLIRVRADVRADAPGGLQAGVLTPALPADFVVAGGFLHGLQNEMGGPSGGVPGAGNLPIAAQADVQIIYDGEEFFRGDSNSDGKVDISDPQATLGFLFLGGPVPACADAGDANDDGHIDISDAAFSLGYLFLGTASPPSPGPQACGSDPTEDGLVPCLEGCP